MTNPFDASTALQSAVYTALSTNTALINALGGTYIFDAVPRNHKPPFVIIDTITTLPLSPDAEGMQEHMVTFIIQTREAGLKQAQTLTSTLSAAMMAIPDTIDTGTIINTTLETQTITRATNNRSHTAALEFRIVTETPQL